MDQMFGGSSHSFIRSRRCLIRFPNGETYTIGPNQSIGVSGCKTSTPLYQRELDRESRCCKSSQTSVSESRALPFSLQQWRGDTAEHEHRRSEGRRTDNTIAVAHKRQRIHHAPTASTFHINCPPCLEPEGSVSPVHQKNTHKQKQVNTESIRRGSSILPLSPTVQFEHRTLSRLGLLAKIK